MTGDVIHCSFDTAYNMFLLFQQSALTTHTFSRNNAVGPIPPKVGISKVSVNIAYTEEPFHPKTKSTHFNLYGSFLPSFSMLAERKAETNLNVTMQVVLH